jgi:hypothetical protein
VPKQRRRRALYALVGILGFVFTLSACAYGVMAFRAVHSSEPYLAESDGGLMRLFREHGGTILAVELAALAIASAAAMAADRGPS